MSSLTTAPGGGPPTTASVRVAEQLRSFLMGSATGSARARAAEVPVVRLPRELVDVRRAAPALLMLPAPPWSDYELRFMARPEVAERLQQAASILPSDVRLGFWEGLRPIAVQQSLWETSLAYLQKAHPELRLPELELILEGYVARPRGVPPHSTGSAVDVAAVDAFGQVMNPANAWGRLGTELVARALRDAGLVNYQPEWWHWSYGDEEWARAHDCAPLAFSASPSELGIGDGI